MSERPRRLEPHVAPQDLDAEESVLGAMLLSPRAIEAVRPALEGIDFYRESHGLIYATALSMAARGDPVDALTLVEELERGGRLGQVGGRMRIRELAANVTACANVVFHAAIVRRKARERAALRTTAAATAAIGAGDWSGARDDLERALAAVAPDPDASWLLQADELLRGETPGPTPFLVEELLVDGAIGAIQGAPKAGKTWLVLELALAIVSGRAALGAFEVAEPGPVIVVLEESGHAALHRRLDSLARGRGMSPESLAGLHVAPNLRVRLDDSRWRERLLAAAAELRPRAIFLDPLVRLKGASVDENSQQEMASVLDFLRDLRDACEGAVVFTHHTGYEGGHLRGTSDLEGYWESKVSVERDEHGLSTLRAEHREADAGVRRDYRVVFDAATGTARLELVQEAARVERDLAAEIGAYLRQHAAAPTSEITREIKARPDSVASTLAADARFVEVPPPPGRKANARCWTLSALLFPDAGNSREEQPPGRSTLCSSEPPTHPLKGCGSREEQTACPSPDPREHQSEADVLAEIEELIREGVLIEACEPDVPGLSQRLLGSSLPLEADGTVDADAELARIRAKYPEIGR